MGTVRGMSKRTEWGLRVARALQDFMRERDITQNQVAEFLGRSQGYVSHRTNGREALTVDIIGAVAVLAHLTPDALTLELAHRAASGPAPEPAEGTGPAA
jgi:transcriptional regulator with XRE-family HTH domain